MAALPFLTFPRIAARSKESDENSDSTAEESSITDSKEEETLESAAAYGQSIKDIPQSIWRLLT